jgi:hypothetical protein
MAINRSADLVITPATWRDQVHYLSRTPANLLNLVGWYGSIHASARWRKEKEWLQVFQERQVTSFDPQIYDWEPAFATLEADIMANASVIVIRLENNELLNGSLGSIAEIGLALTSAALRGQIVVVSIQEGLLTSLNESGAIAQYMMLEMSLENVEKVAELDGVLQIHRGDNLHELALMACGAAERQLKDGQMGLNFQDFLLKRARRRQNYPRRVLLGGSGGPYAQAHEPAFRQKKQTLVSAYKAEGQPVKILSEGAIAKAWKIPYGSIDKISVALATRTLLAIESEFKREADILLLPIMAEAASKAAATEIGFLLLYALTTGQDVKIYLEPFDPVDYIRHQLKNVEVQAHLGGEKDIRLILQQAGVANHVLATAVREEIFEVFELFKMFATSNRPTLKQVKDSLLGKTDIFLNADNISRVRALVRAHLERLDADERFAGFFSYSNHIIA